jgi:hypothetical protein
MFRQIAVRMDDAESFEASLRDRLNADAGKAPCEEGAIGAGIPAQA